MSENSLDYQEAVAIARLHALLELLPTALDKHLATVGLTSFEYILLDALRTADSQRLRLTALAAKTNATLPRLSRVVSGLERKGLLEKVPCPGDGRATNAVITPKGEELALKARPVYAAAVRTMVLDGLDEQQVNQLANLAYAVLTKLDPRGRLAVLAEADPEQGQCSADPVRVCAADPGPEGERACAADPEGGA